MTKFFLIVIMFRILILVIMGWLTANHAQAQDTARPRLLITTDIGGDPDDMQSLIRLMVYTNEFIMEGFVASASGTPGELDREVVRPDLIKKVIRAYEAVYPNLKLHDSFFPLPDSLMALVKSGNPQRGLQFIGEGHATEGSEWIIRKVDESDQMLNVAVWGGQTDLAQALWQVKYKRDPEEYRHFISKVRVYDIADQDSLATWITSRHPGLFYILNRASLSRDKREAVFRGMYLDGNLEITSPDWLNAQVIREHGPLGALYPTKTWTAPNPYGAMKEGDTPSWYYFYKNGLQVPEYPEYGGWGGRFALTEGKVYNDHTESWEGTANARVTVARWREEFQNDFAARMDWCVRDPANSNHAPVPVVNKDASVDPLYLIAAPGDSLILDASHSTDPDGDRLRYEWMIYPKGPEVSVAGSREAVTTLIMPDLKNDSLFLLLKVVDEGVPPLTGYKRIIVRHHGF